ncbi:MAG: hypothetical protein LC667_17070 [Thioalkalivibrio sp.]|nr:hypothetical protein [Thioalkalivibrio sp.]
MNETTGLVMVLFGECVVSSEYNMQAANVLSDRHQALAERFASLAQARGEMPVFAIEHGLDDQSLWELRRTVSRQLEEDPQIGGAAWSWSYLPLLVVATEVGYRYRGTGTDFWPVLAQELGTEAGPSFRIALSRLFELGHRSSHLARPGDSPWERHFPHISWPIGNSLVPLEIQPQLTNALRRAVRAGISADDAESLLEYTKMLAAGHSSRRFENWLLQSDVATEVMRRLLARDASGWLSESILMRIDRDIQDDRGAYRAITEARKTVARQSASLVQITPSRFVFALTDGAPSQLIIRGPALPAQLRDEVIAALRIHGDRIRATDGAQAISLASFLAGGEITLNKICSFPLSPLRRDDALDVDEGTAYFTMERLQPLEPEFFVIESNGLAAHAVFPNEKLQQDSGIIQCIHVDDDGTLETRILDTSASADVEFLRRRGFVIADRVPSLQLLGLPAPGSPRRFLGGFPVLATQRGTSVELLLDGSAASGEVLRIHGMDWKALRSDIGLHLIEPADGRELDRLEFEVIEPPDLEPAAVKVLPANADVSDLEAGRLEIRIAAPLALEKVPIRIRIISPNEPALASEGVIERLPTKITGRSPLIHDIQMQLAGRQARDSGLRLHIEVEGLLEKIISLPPVRRELRYDWDTGKWTSTVDEDRELPSVGATAAAPLLEASNHDCEATSLVLPDARDHEALSAGLIISGQASTRLGLGERSEFSLPARLREPSSSRNGVGLIELEAVQDVPEALIKWNDDLAGDLDLAVIDAYEDLRHHLEASGIETFEEVDMSRPAETWREALERSREITLLPMFRPFILPEARWSALIKPWYNELSEDDLVDLLDASHVDAFRRPGLRWLGRAEIRTMLQLWLSPKTMVETEGWRDLLAKGLSDIRTCRAVRYAALRRKLALGDLPERSTN